MMISDTKCVQDIRNCFMWPSNPLATYDNMVQTACEVLKQYVDQQTAKLSAEVEQLKRQLVERG